MGDFNNEGNSTVIKLVDEYIMFMYHYCIVHCRYLHEKLSKLGFVDVWLNNNNNDDDDDEGNTFCTLNEELTKRVSLFKNNF